MPSDTTRGTPSATVRSLALMTCLLATAAAGAIASQTLKPQGRTLEGGVFTAAQTMRGAATYSRECSTCHGEKLEGGEGSPALSGRSFNASYGGQTVAALFNKIRETMPAPPEQPGKLSPQETADVVAHILHVNGFPAGDIDLPADVSQLERLVITAKPLQRAGRDMARDYRQRLPTLDAWRDD
jgi:mono/diheme cytochrome c family protein